MKGAFFDTAVRLDAPTRERIEAQRLRLSEPWREMTKRDIVKLLVAAGLEVVEGELAGKGPATTKGERS